MPVQQRAQLLGLVPLIGVAGTPSSLLCCAQLPGPGVPVRLLCMPGLPRDCSAACSKHIGARKGTDTVNNMWAGATATACCLPCTTWRLLSPSCSYLKELLTTGATTGLGLATTALPLRRCLRLRHDQRTMSFPTQPAR